MDQVANKLLQPDDRADLNPFRLDEMVAVAAEHALHRHTAVGEQQPKPRLDLGLDGSNGLHLCHLNHRLEVIPVEDLFLHYTLHGAGRQSHLNRPTCAISRLLGEGESNL